MRRTSMGTTAMRALVASIALALAAAAPASAQQDGTDTSRDVFAFGDAQFHGSTGGLDLAAPVVGTEASPTGGGYWEVASDGGVFAYGDAGFFGSLGDIDLDAPIVGMAAAPDGGGYWLVAADGGVFAFGDTEFHGSVGDIQLARPVVDIVAAPTGGGYWLVASDGGVFTFGDAQFHGSAGDIDLVAPIVGMDAPPEGGGYWLAARDGGVFTFGDIEFHGSAGDIPLARPVTGIAAISDGYWLVARDGGVFTFGGAAFHGSLGDVEVGKPIIDIAPSPGGGGYWLLAQQQVSDTCVSRVDSTERWRVPFPTDWHTNSGEVEPECSFFDPEPFELEPGTESFDIAISMRIASVGFEQATDPDRCATVQSRNELTIDGRRAVVMEKVSTGRCILPEGVDFVQYFADLGDRTFIASTYDVGDNDFDQNREVLRDMMRGIDLLV
jgi:hypothetical protein